MSGLSIRCVDTLLLLEQIRNVSIRCSLWLDTLLLLEQISVVMLSSVSEEVQILECQPLVSTHYKFYLEWCRIIFVVHKTWSVVIVL
jgi:hypothetical protein